MNGIDNLGIIYKQVAEVHPELENLQAVNIDSVAIIGSISLEGAGNAQLSAVLARHQENWPRRRVDKLGRYEVEGVWHYLALDIVEERRSNADIVAFNLDSYPISSAEPLRAATRARQKRHFTEIQSILADLARLNLQSRRHAHISWRFPAGSKRPIVRLPLLTIQNPDAPFSEISGIRLRKTDGDSATSVIIDLLSDQSLAVTTVFPLTGVKISDTLLDTAVQRGCQLIGDFVLDSDNLA